MRATESRGRPGARLLLRFHRFLDFRFQLPDRRAGAEAGDAQPDDAFGIDNDVRRKTFDLEGAVDDARRIDVLRPQHLVFVDVVHPDLLVSDGIRTDADHFEVRAGESLVHTDQTWRRRDAWRAPGAPEIEQHGLAGQILVRQE